MEAGGKDNRRKRPLLIVRDDRFDNPKSITICSFTTNPAEAPLFPLVVEPDAENGIRAVCRLTVDKITTVPKSKLHTKIGCLADPDIVRRNRAMVVLLA